MSYSNINQKIEQPMSRYLDMLRLAEFVAG